MKEKKILIATFFYFTLLLLLVLVLISAKDFHVLDVENSPGIYIFIYFIIVASLFTTPLVIVYSTVMLKK